MKVTLSSLEQNFVKIFYTYKVCNPKKIVRYIITVTEIIQAGKYIGTSTYCNVQ